MHPERRRRQVPRLYLRTRRQSFLVPPPAPTEPELPESSASIKERPTLGTQVLLSSRAIPNPIPSHHPETCLFIR
jgi:hypothetical protein